MSANAEKNIAVKRFKTEKIVVDFDAERLRAMVSGKRKAGGD